MRKVRRNRGKREGSGREGVGVRREKEEGAREEEEGSVKGERGRKGRKKGSG